MCRSDTRRTSSRRTRLASALRQVGLAITVTAVLAWPATALATDVNAAIASDTVWTAAGNPYNVSLPYPARLVPEGVTLTLEPGVEIRADGIIEIDGTLVAIGTPAQRISFDEKTPGHGFGGLLLTRLLPGTVSENVLQYVDFNHLLGPVLVSRQSLTMTDCTLTASSIARSLLTSFGGVGGTYPDATLTITNNTFTLTSSYSEGGWTPRDVAALWLDGHDAFISGNTIAVSSTGSLVVTSGIYATESNSGPSVVTATGNTVSVTAQHENTPNVYGIFYGPSVSGAIEGNTVANVLGPQHVDGIHASSVSTIADNVVSARSSSSTSYAYVNGIYFTSTTNMAAALRNRVEVSSDSEGRQVTGILAQAGTIGWNRVTGEHTGTSGSLRGIANQFYPGSIVNNTIVLSSSGVGTTNGIETANTSGELTVENNIVVGDGRPGSTAIHSSSPALVTTRYNLTSGWESVAFGLTPGTGHRSGDPMFADAAFHLGAGSPAVDAGNWDSDFSLEPAPNGGRIDMGAFGNTAGATPSIALVAPEIETNGGSDFSTTAAVVTLTGRTSASSVAVTVNGSSAGVTYAAGATSWTYTGSLAVGANTRSVQGSSGATWSAADSIVISHLVAPTLTSLTPGAGPLAGGTPVTVTGTGFIAGATSVTVGGTPATGVVVTGATSLTAVMPAGAAGTATVAVTTAAGSATLSSGFTYLAGPTISGVSPGAGPLGGGTTVTLTGTGFVSDATSVTIGGTAATGVVVIDSTSLVAVTPAGAAGAAAVTVTTAGGSTVPSSGFTYVALPTVTNVTPGAGPLGGGTTVTVTGTNFVAGATGVTVGGSAAADVNVATPTSLTVVTPAGTPGPATLVVTTPGGSASLADGYRFERHRRYFAEGATGGALGFATEVALVNPDPITTADVTLQFLKSDGSQTSLSIAVPPEGRRTVDAATVSGLEAAEFSTIVDSDMPLVAARTLRWDSAGYGSHAETSIQAPSTVWYLAEGATHSGFDLFYLIQNANDAAADVEVTYIRPAPAPPVVRTYTVAARSRFNIWVDLEPDLGNTDVSAVIRSDLPVIVERAMYRTTGGQPFAAGHNSAGVTSPATSWFFAEGATGPYFDLFILIANTEETTAEVTATYLLPSGGSIERHYTIAARSRANIWVDLEDPRLADTAVSTILTSTNAVPVIAERSMWWPGPTSLTWAEAHNSPGSTTTALEWAFAQGEHGGPRNTATYILIANTSSSFGQARVRLFFEDGSPAVERTFELRPNSRLNVDPSIDFADRFSGASRRFGGLVQSIGISPVPIVVECATYSDAAGVHWAAGTNTLATPTSR